MEVYKRIEFVTSPSTRRLDKNLLEDRQNGKEENPSYWGCSCSQVDRTLGTAIEVYERLQFATSPSTRRLDKNFCLKTDIMGKRKSLTLGLQL